MSSASESSSAPVRLGPFALEVPIGRGGMGQVWRAVHVEQETLVAVKVITAERALRPNYLSAFKNEVRAAAGLDHPSIVMVLDYGRIPEDTARAASERFVAGSPYLVMELVDGGSLKQYLGKLSWPELRLTLLYLLDALAHAHARGMIHRDIKPANVLLDRVRRFVKLTDFGLAHALEPEGMEEPIMKGGVGTPAYMPPEQIQRRWRDYGPWTDLYALGCLAYELVCGKTPFGKAPDRETFRAHLRRKMPRLEPKFEVPRELEAWIARLLEKDPLDRFRRAADAAHALLSFSPASDESEAARLPGLDDPTDPTPAVRAASQPTPTRPQPAPPEDANQAAQGATLETAALAATGDASEGETLPASAPYEMVGPFRPRDRGAIAAAVPPLPASWRPKEERRVARPLIGAGLGLYGLRAIPLVDREKERDRLWAELARVHETRRGRVVILEGPTGCGKSKLAEWLSERAHEVGAATSLRAVHAPNRGSNDGIAPMLARHLRVVGLPRSELAARVETALAAQSVRRLDEAIALTELVSPAAEDRERTGPQIIRFANAAERHVLAVRYLERLARERPVIVQLEDAQWGVDSLRFAAQLLAAQEAAPFPVLLVITVRTEALLENSEEAELVKALAASSSALSLYVDALEPEHRSILVRELLGLEGELAGRVEERTAGNPLFAVQLVGDFVQRGVLEAGRHGFRLKHGTEVKLPDNLHQVWSGALDRVLEGRHDDDRRALEIAAVLGQDVDAEEWRRTLERAQIHASPDLIETLLEQRLAHAGERGPESSWSFVHGMLRESLERRAREEGRWKGYNHACAEVVRFRAEPGAKERLGRHLLEAGHAAHAIEPLTIGALERLDAGDYRLAEVLLADRERAMMEIDLPPTDPRWGEGFVHRGRLSVLLGDHARAQEWTQRAAEHAKRYDWRQVSGMAYRELGRLARLRGDHKNANVQLELAQAFAKRVGDVRLLAECRRDVAYLHLARGMLGPAEEDFQGAREHYDAIGDVLGRARCDIGLGELAREAGRLEAAHEHVQRAREGFERSGSRKGVSECLNALGELARLAGDLERAEGHYKEALEIRLALGAANAIVCELNIGLVRIERGAHQDAREMLEQCLRALERQANKKMMGCVHVCLLPATIALGDRAAFDRHLRSAAALLGETGFVDVDNARMAELAGDLARRTDDPDRAREAYAIARQQWHALGRSEEERGLEAKLRSVSTARRSGE